MFITDTIDVKKSEIAMTGLCVVIGFLFAYPAYGLFGPRIDDGPCSGVWGPIAFSCYIPDILYSGLAIIIPTIIFHKKSMMIAWLAVILFLIMCVSVGFVFQTPLMFFTRTYYIPSILGVWVSIWTVLVVVIGITFLVKRLDKNNVQIGRLISLKERALLNRHKTHTEKNV